MATERSKEINKKKLHKHFLIPAEVDWFPETTELRNQNTRKS